MGRIGFSILVLLFFSCLVSAAYEDVSLTYDANGNLIQDADYYYEYNGFNNLVRVREDDSGGRIVSEFVYTPDGKRIKKRVNKTEGWETTYYIGDIVRVVNSSGTFDTVYVHDNQGVLLARQEDDGKKYYYHPDHLGSTRLITDQAGDVVEEIEYLPFGADLTNSTQKYTFTGQESDSELNLMYYGARYHSPYLRQFTQPDTIIPNIYYPQSLNRYSYTYNNPIFFKDISGHLPNQAQAVDSNDFVAYVASVEASNPGMSVNEVINEASAQFIRHELSFGEAWKGAGDSTSNMYFHTADYGWIDGMHFLGCADFDLDTGSESLTKAAGYGVEVLQAFASILPKVDTLHSAFSTEDLSSDWAGIGFAEYVKANQDSGLTASELLSAYLETIGSTDKDDPSSKLTELPPVDNKYWDHAYRSGSPSSKSYPNGPTGEKRLFHLGGTREKK